jgi:hypothetical protein
MKKNIFKTILVDFTKYITKRKQMLIYSFLLIVAILYFVYTLGYSSNWAIIVNESRGANFFRASQSANRVMFDIAFFLLVFTLLALAFGSMKRKHFYLSNIVLSIISSVLMLVASIITLYYNSVLSRMYARITEEEIPAFLYSIHGAKEKSFLVFELGNILSIVMILISLLLVWFLVFKLRMQKERKQIIKEMIKL